MRLGGQMDFGALMLSGQAFVVLSHSLRMVVGREAPGRSLMLSGQAFVVLSHSLRMENREVPNLTLLIPNNKSKPSN